MIKRTLLILFLLRLVFHSQAQTWTQYAAATNNYWPYVACSADGSTVFAAQDDPYKNVRGIYKSTNSGKSWFVTSAPTNGIYHGVVVSADGNRVTLASAKGMYSSTNAGNSWFLVGATNADWWNLIASADGNKLCAVTNPASNPPWLYTSVDAGNTWIKRTNSFGYDSWGSCASSADGTKIVAQASGKTLRSTNAGESWYILTNAPRYTAVEVPSQYLACSADGTIITFASNLYGNSRLQSPIYLSTNSGESWFASVAPSNFWSALSMSADGSRMLAATGPYSLGASASITVSDDGGATWVTTALTNQDIIVSDCSADGCKMYVASGWGWFNNAGRIYSRYSPATTKLNLTTSNNHNAAKVTWVVSSTNVILQRSADLKNWSATTNPPVLNTDSLQNELTVPAAGSRQFFRLVTP